MKDVVYQAILIGEADRAAEGVLEALEEGEDPQKILNEQMIAAMVEVGRLYEEQEYFIPEMMISARAMQHSLRTLEPRLTRKQVKPLGKFMIGTVKGDLHDIGKNLVAMMMEGAGFEVTNLGINTSVEEFLAALDEHEPNILGMSALLTTTMPYMKVVIDALKEQGIRDKYIVMVGGAPLNEEFGNAVGADAYCRDAATAVEIANKLIGRPGALA